MKPLVEIKDLTIGFQEGKTISPAVKGISFEVREGEILGVVGESGSGKSMSALALMGLLPKDAIVTQGQILFKGTDLLTMKDEEKRKLQGSRMAMVFQEPMTSLNPVMKIEKQVGESLKLHTSLSDKEIHERVTAALEEVGLSDPESLCTKYPHELSGGMRQRVMLAQATVCSPDLIIADEPTTALDVIVQAQILRLLKKIHRENNTSILFISHDLNVIKEICDRVIVVYKGDIVEEGVTREVLLNPKHDYTKRLVASIPEDHAAGGNGREILRLEDLNVYYDTRTGAFWKKKGKKHVIHDVSMTAYDGEILGIVGESGCGKSTLGRALVRLLKPTEGHIYMGGTDIAGLKGADLKKMRRKVQIIFQDPSACLNPRRTVRQILMEPFEIHGMKGKMDVEARIMKLLNLVGLDLYCLSRYPHELSGGQKQRIGIARALALEPDIIICDEAVSALDVSVQAQVLNLLQELKEKLGLTYFFISHNLNVVYQVSDRVGVMYLGNMVEIADYDKLYEKRYHPYTEALLSAIPQVDQGVKTERIHLEGEVPSPSDPPSGCRFHTRCPKACDRCRQEVPRLKEVAEGHFVACHLY